MGHVRKVAVAVAVSVLLLAGCGGGGESGDGEVSVVELSPGECFDSPAPGSDTELEDVERVPCSEPHENEVYATFEHPAGPDAPFPGTEAIERVAEAGCLDRFESFAGVAYEASDLSIATIAPLEEAWERAGDREIACVLKHPAGEPLVGSRRSTG